MTHSSSSGQRLTAACRLGFFGAVATLAGIVLSGPLAVVLVEVTHPQPAWTDAATFARSFHAIQILPYPGGIVLVAGLLLLVSAVAALAGPSKAPLATVGLLFAAVFAAMIFLNYVVQSCYVPVLARDFAPDDGPLVAALSMANPTSLAWAVELWGWGFLGVATMLLAPVFHGSGVDRAARWTFAANGPVSIAGAVATALAPGWAMTLTGLALFALWNALLAAMAVLALLAFRRRLG